MPGSLLKDIAALDAGKKLLAVEWLLIELPTAVSVAILTVLVQRTPQAAAVVFELIAAVSSPPAVTRGTKSVARHSR